MHIDIQIDPKVLSELNIYLDTLKKKWDDQYPDKKSWLSLHKTYVLNSTIFLISVLDDLIVFVQSSIPRGADKKLAVMAVLSKIFDYIVVQAFPVWMTPFAAIIKEMIVGVVISQLVEFIVSKYKNGEWKTNSNLKIEVKN